MDRAPFENARPVSRVQAKILAAFGSQEKGSRRAALGRLSS